MGNTEKNTSGMGAGHQHPRREKPPETAPAHPAPGHTEGTWYPEIEVNEDLATLIRVAVALHPELRFQEQFIIQGILDNYAKDAANDNEVLLGAGDMALDLLAEWKQTEMKKLAAPAKVIRKSGVSSSGEVGK